MATPLRINRGQRSVDTFLWKKQRSNSGSNTTSHLKPALLFSLQPVNQIIVFKTFISDYRCRPPKLVNFPLKLRQPAGHLEPAELAFCESKSDGN